jgi:predicted permease
MLMIMLGYYLTSKKWFNKEVGQLFSKLAMTVTIPLYMIVSMMKSYTRNDLLQLGIAVVMPACTMVVTFLIGVAVSYIIRVPSYRHGTFRAMFFVANTAFIGFPVNAALFGVKALPIAVMVYLVQSLLFWTIGAYGMSLDGPKFARLEGNTSDNLVSPKIFSTQTLKKIMSPPLIGAMVAILLILGGVNLPTFLNSTFNYLGGMTTPLAMLFIGIAIYIADLRNVHITLDMAVLIVARFVIAPAVVIVACHFVAVPDLMRKVFVIEAAMPVMTQCSIAARAYKADANYVAVMTALTTVLSMITIPTFFILLNFGIL